MPWQNQILAGSAGAGGGGLELYAWGASGGYFHDDTTSRCVPVQVGTDKVWDGDPNITDRKINAMESGYNLIQADGSLWWTGGNTYGGSGLGNTINYSSPVQVGTLKDWEFIRGGRSVLSVKTDGTLWAFGYNGSGQIGDETTINRYSPVQVGTESDWTHAACGHNAVGAIRGGKLFTWGHWRGNGQGASKNTISSPVQIGTATNWTDIHAAPTNTYAIAGGALYSTGHGASGANGDGTVGVETFVFNQVGTLTNWHKLAGSQRHNAGSMAIKTDGTLWGWGNNAGGSLMVSSSGPGDTRASPIQLGDSDDWIDASYGAAFCCGIRDSGDGETGSLWTWGLNYSGAQGNGDTISRSSPTQVGSDTDWRGCTTGNDHINAVK